MPVCFQLLRDNEPVSFTQVDEEMCKHFNAPVSHHYYYHGWYDIVGLELAMGKTFEQIAERHPDMKRICGWLKANFTPKSWWEPKS